MFPFRRLYVQCNPLLDISAVVDQQFLDKYKIVNGTSSLMTDDHVGIFEEIAQRPDVTYVPGGSGLNTARVAQWVSQLPKGSFVTYVGCIALDKYGIILKEAAENEGLNMVLEYTTTAPTGTCTVCVVDKGRSLVANLGAASQLSPDHIMGPAVAKALKDVDFFYLTGFTLTINMDYVFKVAEASLAAKGVFAMNLSALFIVQYFTEQLNKVLPYVDLLFANEDEAKALAKIYGFELDDTLQLAIDIVEKLPYSGIHDRTVVITQGGSPAVYATKSGSHSSVPAEQIDPDAIVDTNAAGDAFVGGFLAAYAAGLSISDSCRLGHYAAGEIIQRGGCTYPPKPKITPRDFMEGKEDAASARAESGHIE